MDIIDVSLYGGKSIMGGKEKPLEACMVSCDMYKECSFFKNNHCLQIRGGSGCKFGKSSTEKGYTSRAQKYHQFKSKWQKHEKYNLLNSPPTKLGVIGDIIVFPYPYVTITETETGQLKLGHPSFSNRSSFIESSKFTVDFVYRVCAFRPQAMMGGEISAYQKEIVPMFLAHLEELLPDLYIKFTTAYKQYANKIDHVGRKALVKTLKPSMVHYTSSSYPEVNTEWYWDGEFLTHSKGRISSFNITNDYEVVEIRIKPSDKSIVRVSSNDQVTKSTIFID